MAINSYTTLVNAVADWLDRDDMSAAISTMVGLMEARLYRELRLQFMETSLSGTISSGVVAIPTDYLSLKNAYLNTNPIQHLQIKTPNWIEAVYAERSASSQPAYIARSEGNFIFGPYPDSDYGLRGVYYAKPTALGTSNETNWLTTNAPDLLLYGTLVHATPYIGKDERVSLWEAGYQDARGNLDDQEMEEQFPSSIPLTQTVL